MITLLNSTTLLRPNQDQSFTSVTLAYKKRIVANGGVISDSSLLAFDNFYRELLSSGIASKVTRLNPILGEDEDACRTPAIAVVGNQKDVDIQNSSDWSEANGLVANATFNKIDMGFDADANVDLPAHDITWGMYFTQNTDDAPSWNSEPSTTPSRVSINVGTQRGNTSSGSFLLTGQGSSVEVFAFYGGGTVQGYMQATCKYDLASPAGTVEVAVNLNGTQDAIKTGGTATSQYTETTKPVVLNQSTTDAPIAGYCIAKWLSEAECALMNTAWENFQSAMGRSPF